MDETTSAEPQVQRKALTEDQVNRFWSDGFLVIGKLFDDDEIEWLRQAYDHEFELARAGAAFTPAGSRRPFRNLSINTDDLEEKNAAESQMLQIMQMCERSLVFHELLYDARILDPVEDLIGPNIQLFHDQALFKPAHHGGPIHWHQDNSYWKCAPPNLVSCWMTLDDVNIQNGAMQFLPGSHIRSIGHNRANDGVLLDATDQVDASRAVGIDLPAGGVTLHHCQTLHHTAPNTTDRQRRAFAIHFMTPGTRRLADPGDLDVSFSRPMLRMRI